MPDFFERGADVLPFSGVTRWRELGASDVAQPPYSAVALIRMHIVDPGGTGIADVGTGWFCAPGVVVTAAHVTRGPFGAQQYHIQVLPSNDFSGTSVHFAASLVDHPSLDLALIHLPSAVIPAHQCLSPIATSGQALMGNSVFSAGYALEWGLGLVASPGVVTNSQSGVLYYDLDTVRGMSGGPVMLAQAGRAMAVVGVHNSGTDFNRVSMKANRNVGLHLDAATVSWIGQHS